MKIAMLFHVPAAADVMHKLCFFNYVLFCILVFCAVSGKYIFSIHFISPWETVFAAAPAVRQYSSSSMSSTTNGGK
jgi:hypothetical protein